MERLKPIALINYQGKDVTGDFAPILTSISFRDHLDGKAGELDIDLTDTKGLFLADWYPDVDDRIEVQMGFEQGDLMECGRFWVDEVKLSGSSSGNTCSIRALSLPSSAINAPQQRCYHQGRELQEIVSEEAQRLGYKVVGDLSGSWEGLQNETGLQFINRLAHETGRILKIEDDTLVFYRLEDILNVGSAVEIDRRDVASYEISDQAAGRIGKCTVKWWDRKGKKLISGSYDAGIKGGGSAVIWQEAKDAAEAQRKAQDYITDRNKSGIEFSFSAAGDVRLRAGITIRMVGFGRFDGLYYVSEAVHVQSNGGYTISVTLQKPEEEK